MYETWKCVLGKLPEAVYRVLGVERAVTQELLASGKLKAAPTPDPRLGDFGVALQPVLKGISYAKWSIVGADLARELYALTRDECWVEKVDFVNGYLNITINYNRILKSISEEFLSGRVFKELRSIGGGEKAIVEHTSANPVHPLHIGSGRNSVIGDTFARLLEKLGFNVETRFYVNDIGRQVATLIYGVRIVESSGVEKPRDLKIDHWYGVIYALTNIIIEQGKLREAINGKIREFVEMASEICDVCSSRGSELTRETCLEICEVSWKRNYKVELLKYAGRIYKLLESTVKPGENPAIENLAKILKELRDLLREYRSYTRAGWRLALYYPEVYRVLKSSIKSSREAEEEITRLMLGAEREDPGILQLFSKTVNEVLSGFRETLSKLGVHFNGFDYESSPEVLKTAHQVVDDLLRGGYARIIEGGAVEVNLDELAEKYDYIKKLFHPDRAGRFIIRRSDGTTLYVTRDIAYSIYKFKVLGASRVYNVIAIEQTREQKQLKAVLYLLGYRREAENLDHFAYEMVHLKGLRMSGRRGLYYTIDEMLVDAKLSILKKLIEKEEKRELRDLLEIAEKLAVANTRAILVSVDPGKVLVFDPGKISEVEYGVMIQYAFVRAQGVVRNLWGLEFLDSREEVIGKTIEYTRGFEGVDLTSEEKKLVDDVLRYPLVLKTAYMEKSPSKILEYALNLAIDFNKFYEKYPVISEKNENTRKARVLITVLTLLALSELIDILGFPKLRRM